MNSKKFLNQNAEPWYRWLCRRSDPLPAVTMYFLSRVNRTSPRFFPLYEDSHCVRVVVVRGLSVPKTDKLILYFVQLLVLVTRKKLASYKVFIDHDFKHGEKILTNTIIQCDDPEYTRDTIEKLIGRTKLLKSQGLKTIVVVTNKFTRDWIETSCPDALPIVIAQGFTQPVNVSAKKFGKFSCVYTSGSIDYKGDRHQHHPSWSASHLIEEIIPRLVKNYPEIEIHLTGRVGPNAKAALLQFSQVFIHGELSREKNAEILRRCHIGLHPRINDHGWQVQKIAEYIGAGLPIVAYDLLDSILVRELNLGILVTNAFDFVQAIGKLSMDQQLYSNLVLSIDRARSRYSWVELARQLDATINALNID